MKDKIDDKSLEEMLLLSSNSFRDSTKNSLEKCKTDSIALALREFKAKTHQNKKTRFATLIDSILSPLPNLAMGASAVLLVLLIFRSHPQEGRVINLSNNDFSETTADLYGENVILAFLSFQDDFQEEATSGLSSGIPFPSEALAEGEKFLPTFSLDFTDGTTKKETTYDNT